MTPEQQLKITVAINEYWDDPPASDLCCALDKELDRLRWRKQASEPAPVSELVIEDDMLPGGENTYVVCYGGAVYKSSRWRPLCIQCVCGCCSEADSLSSAGRDGSQGCTCDMYPTGERVVGVCVRNRALIVDSLRREQCNTELGVIDMDARNRAVLYAELCAIVDDTLAAELETGTAVCTKYLTGKLDTILASLEVEQSKFACDADGCPGTVRRHVDESRCNICGEIYRSIADAELRRLREENAGLRNVVNSLRPCLAMQPATVSQSEWESGCWRHLYELLATLDEVTNAL